jgi:hypothetical protein
LAGARISAGLIVTEHGPPEIIPVPRRRIGDQDENEKGAAE